MARQKIKFEDIDPPGIPIGATIAEGYAGLRWNNFGALYTPDLPRSGYVPRSGDGVGSNSFALPAAFSDPEGDRFAFKKAAFSAAWNDGLTVTVEGFAGSTLVNTTSFVVDYGEDRTVKFGKLFQSVDFVRISSSGGVDHDPLDQGNGANFVIDDMVLRRDDLFIG
jgi:hypothetical protein